MLERWQVSPRPPSEGDRPGVRLSPSDGGRGDSTLPYTVSFRSINELSWGMKMSARQTSRQNGRRVLSFNPTPLLEVGAILYCLIRCQQPKYDFERKYIRSLGKMGATPAAFR